MNFVAIDFETARPERASACSVGLVVVRDGKIADRFSTLICPPNLDFNPRNIAIHGITPADVCDKPTFQEIWPELGRRFGSDMLVAHNASFDMGVLYRSLSAADIPLPNLKCACTVAMAKQLLPGLNNHKLPTLAALFGIEFDHHDAAADAAVCAQIAILLSRLAVPEGIAHFARDFSDMCSPHEPPDYSGVGVHIAIDGLDDDELDDLQADLDELNGASKSTDTRFAGLRFVFTGELARLTRAEAESIVHEKGGEAGNSVSGKTDFVIVGDAALDAYERTGHTTGKLAKAVGLKANGEKVKIIREAEFIQMTR